LTSLINEALGGLILTLQAFKMVNSNILEAAILELRFPDKESLEIIKLIAVLQEFHALYFLKKNKKNHALYVLTVSEFLVRSVIF